MLLLHVALQNLGRSWQRTMATGCAIAFGVAVLVFMDAWVHGIGAAIRQYAASARLGALQIHRAGYFERPDAYPLDAVVPTDEALLDELRAVPGVGEVAPRLALSGTVSNGVDETMFLGSAIEPGQERAVCPRFLEGDLRAGRMLQDGDGDVVVIGTGLSAALGADVGAMLTLEVRDAGGRMNAVDVQVVGIAASSLPDEAKWLVVLPLPTAQRLTRMQNTATSLVLSVDDIEDADQVAASVRSVLAKPSLSVGGVGFEVRTWRETGLYFEQAVRTFAFAQTFLLVILATLVVLVMLNTAVVSASERTAEIATLMALGAPRASVARLFLLEALLLGACAGAFGAILGTLASSSAARVGVPFEPPNQPPILVFPEWSLAFGLLSVVGAVATAAIGAFVPAVLVSRRRPAEVLRG